jgi:glutamate-1-semialdehyde 2,1-aminomutase
MPQTGFALSHEMFDIARGVIAGGVTSAVRAGVRPHPLYFDRGQGSALWDVDGNKYIDFALGYGPLILGHAPLVVRDALHAQIDRGMTFGAQHALEIEAAELLVAAVPGAEQAIFSSTGSEAVAAAIRVARGATGRPLILKFEGHYHGWFDGTFVSTAYDPDRSGPPAHPAVVPQTAGMAPSSNADTIVAPWNDLKATADLLDEHRGQVAAVLLEPLAVNGGVIPADPGLLEGLRALTSKHGTILIFDEVITGFRLALGGAQEYYGVTADLAVFAKAIAGGVAFSAVTGSRELLRTVSEGRVVHNGTFNGNPLAAAAAVATMRHLAETRGEVYPRLNALGARLASGLSAASPDLRVRQVGPILNGAIGEPPGVRSVRDRAGRDAAAYERFVEGLLHRGIHTTPRGLWYLSTAHTEADVDRAIEAAKAVFAAPTTELTTTRR